MAKQDNSLGKYPDTPLKRTPGTKDAEKEILQSSQAASKSCRALTNFPIIINHPLPFASHRDHQ